MKRAQRVIPVPVTASPFAPDRYGYTDATEVFQDELGLPKRVDLFTSARLYEIAISNFCNEPPFATVDSSKGKPRQDGILRFRYAVTESTNFLGWNLPLRFEYVAFEPDTMGNLVPRCSGAGGAKSIRIAEKPDGVFAAGLKQTVIDWRFREDRKVDALTYAFSNEAVFPVSEPVLLKKFESAKQAAEKAIARNRPLRSSRWALAAIVLFSMMSAWLLLSKNIQRSKPPNIQ